MRGPRQPAALDARQALTDGVDLVDRRARAQEMTGDGALFLQGQRSAGATQLAEAPPESSTSTRSSRAGARPPGPAPARRRRRCRRPARDGRPRSSAGAPADGHSRGGRRRGRRCGRDRRPVRGNAPRRPRPCCRRPRRQHDQPSVRRRLQQVRRQAAGGVGGGDGRRRRSPRAPRALPEYRSRSRHLPPQACGGIAAPPSSSAGAIQMPARMIRPPAAPAQRRRHASASTSQPSPAAASPLQEDHQGGEHRRQRAERHGEQPLAADMADPGERDQHRPALQARRKQGLAESQRGADGDPPRGRRP